MITLAWISLSLAVLSAAIIAFDEFRHPQPMGVMNIVWPLTALYFSVLALPAYFLLGRKRAHSHRQDHSEMQMPSHGAKPKLTFASVATGTSHCGAGCTVADVLSEFALASTGLVLFGSALLTSFTLDFIAAWVIGIAFQYFAIRPMRQELSTAQVIVAAMKADTLSILAFQIGMYAWMAWAHSKLIPGITAFDPRFWLSMQAAMICGFATSLPMNAWLIRLGLKEAM
ncbi:MAG: DUF4396 domain-containing protein [Acidobacteriaceae bacterium]|nr:DUF4396 domain-containing protein [Acidobacteriaceae bacterium]